ncbi:hypothetical protein PoB_003142300 [Plakobranchus ocellatus]|uniref:Uncharacterized protein n=1 Tax=Plakobranchus ocellatus TaxID=259542 RepID=A0AAV4AEC8_9GAST|nr:hypothetical protein PoB_003142300 [Plakobranchus ocellatus]
MHTRHEIDKRVIRFQHRRIFRCKCVCSFMKIEQAYNFRSLFLFPPLPTLCVRSVGYRYEDLLSPHHCPTPSAIRRLDTDSRRPNTRYQPACTAKNKKKGRRALPHLFMNLADSRVGPRAREF